MDDDQECSICCETYNKSTRKCVECPYCNYEACQTCIRTHILSSVKDPSCPNCNKAYNQEFIVMKLNKTWFNGPFKKHRKNILTDSIISRCPEAMGAAENYVISEKLEDRNREIADEINNLNILLHKLKNEQVQNYNTIYRIQNGHYEKQSSRKFIMPCPDNDCRGYLSTSYKCELCGLYTCPKCHEIVGDRKDNPHHVCKEESVKSAELIKKETKPCPKCGIPIFKISGCDQMWCTECHVAFSWRTGRIETGVVHNPHFYQWQRDANNGEAPRVPGDIPCGGMPDWWGFRDKLNRIIGNRYFDFNFRYEGNAPEYTEIIKNVVTQMYNYFLPIHATNQRVTIAFSGIEVDKDGKIVWHDKEKIKTAFLQYLTETFRGIQEIIYDRTRMREKITELENDMEIRIRYLLKRITKEEMGSIILKRDNQRRKLVEFLNIYDLIHNVGIETFQYIINMDVDNSCDKSCLNFINNTVNKLVILTNLRNYCNEQMKTISITYSINVPFYDKVWYKTSKKYKMKDYKTNEKINSNENNGIGKERFHTFTVEHLYSKSDFPLLEDETPILIHTTKEKILKGSNKKDLHSYLSNKFNALAKMKITRHPFQDEAPIYTPSGKRSKLLFTITCQLEKDLEYLYVNHDDNVVETSWRVDAVKWMSYSNKIQIQWNGSRVYKDYLENMLLSHDEIKKEINSKIIDKEKEGTGEGQSNIRYLRMRSRTKTQTSSEDNDKEKGGEGEGEGEGEDEDEDEDEDEGELVKNKSCVIE